MNAFSFKVNLVLVRGAGLTALETEIPSLAYVKKLTHSTKEVELELGVGLIFPPLMNDA